MQMSANGRKFLEGHEGLRLHAYQDSVGVWTLGYGHTSAAGTPHVYANSKITTAEADLILSQDLHQFEVAVTQAIKKPINQNQFDACCSLAFNIGAGRFMHSTVVKRINEGDFEGAANAFLMWVHPPELEGRRHDEVALFETPVTVAVAKDEAKA